MLFGILPPYRTGVVADPHWIREFTRHAEGVGFESVYVVEHVAVPAGYATRYPYSDTGRMPLPDDCPIPDPFELLAYLAGVTDRIVLATGIAVAPEHHPLALAKRAATVDVLSGGRMRLGLGVGWMREELEALGIDPAERGTRTDELLEALAAVWSAQPASYAGRHFAFAEVHSVPRPRRAGGVPIHIGGHSPAAARRAGRFGEGFQPLGLDEALLGERLGQVRAAADAAGRDADAIELTLGALLDDCDAATVERAAANGASRLLLSTRSADLDEVRPAMDAFAGRCLP